MAPMGIGRDPQVDRCLRATAIEAKPWARVGEPNLCPDTESRRCARAMDPAGAGRTLAMGTSLPPDVEIGSRTTRRIPILRPET